MEEEAEEEEERWNKQCGQKAVAAQERYTSMRIGDDYSFFGGILPSRRRLPASAKRAFFT
eukprot:EC788193.1.p3 GENE.EC788193.1~~EC788193.1.p3  ORF type:complete len:60 (-),score=8.68 EC788193.1:119-298(-)